MRWRYAGMNFDSTRVLAQAWIVLSEPVAGMLFLMLPGAWRQQYRLSKMHLDVFGIQRNALSLTLLRVGNWLGLQITVPPPSA